MIKRLVEFLSGQIIALFARAGKPIGAGVSKIILLCLLAFPLCCCCILSIVYAQTPGDKAISTARVQTQTAMPTKMIIPSATNRPTETTMPTKTIQPSGTVRPTRTITITGTAAKTNMPEPTFTLTKIPTTSAPCNCGIDYDCADFSTQRKAQTCFDYCGGSKSYNFSRLDGNDKDGRVCESLP